QRERWRGPRRVKAIKGWMSAIKVARNGLLSRFFLHPTTLRSFSRLPAEISRKTLQFSLHAITPTVGMKRFVPVIVFVCAACFGAAAQTSNSPAQSNSQHSSQAGVQPAPAPPPNVADENTRKAKALVERSI